MARLGATFPSVLLVACARAPCDPGPLAPASTFDGTTPGESRAVAGLALAWIPAGSFTMGSPRDEPERRPGEDQVAVTLTKGFWMASYETTQGDWKRVVGSVPSPTDELPLQDDLPVGNVNFAEVEDFCARLTELAHASGELPVNWEFRLP